MNPLWLERKQQTPVRRDGDHRTPFQRDKARILHSAAFRRLQAKTQVLGVGLSDFHRTRLTHSLEASQIGQGIAAQIASKFPQTAEDVALDENLIEALCLAHDIGHPPFGHGGEIALHHKMVNHGGFEGNAQTFRIVTRLEPYTLEYGMNLSRRTVLGLVKYPNTINSLTNDSLYTSETNSRFIHAGTWCPPKGLYECDSELFDWLLAPLSESDKQYLLSYDTFPNRHSKTRFKSFDCSVMELADDIAYGIHDMEDAIVTGLITRAQFFEEVVKPVKHIERCWLADNIEQIGVQLFCEHHQRKEGIGALVNAFITAIEVGMADSAFEANLLKYNATLPDAYHQALNVFKQFVLTRVIRHPDIQRIEFKGQKIVIDLFDAFASDPARLLPESTRVRWEKASERDQGYRVIADYISGMTDGYAAKLFNTLFLPVSDYATETGQL
ncbi:anti-phage deoxyguanosine triphosphatase [Aestuariibacter sp. AA17]|uniref:Deoxyguanosinetriphosphate triphosphohydrolase-like protein n=1 Tax=Fluctibacter corallii TaxID=2984329 RepID=A0ABT3A659_9ALTE|nr:anti-phage deoxyguanosine triphosphatase [Aestuariibacter sp. AA17]MCV2884120.1 anti-phage deoxyguanosine triphosphatase [Aestuariibacter sp. AA17]